MNKLLTVLSLALVAFGLLAISNAPATADPKGSSLHAKLIGDVIGTIKPKGHAEYESETRRKGTKSQLEVEVEHVNLATDTVLTVCVDGTSVGTITLKKAGEGKLKLSTKKGDTVPLVVSGSVMLIKAADGTTVLSGTF